MSVCKLDAVIFYCLAAYALFSSISVSASRVLIAIACVVALIRYYKQLLPANLDKGLVKAVGLFLLAVAVTGLFGYHPVQSLNRVWAMFYRMVPLILVVMFVHDRDRLIKLVVMLAVSMLITDSYAIWNGLHGNLRATAFTSIMTLAGSLAQLLPFMLVVGCEDKRLSAGVRGFILGTAGLSMLALLYNGTRGAWVAVVLAIVLYGFINIGRNKKILAGILLVLFTIMIVVVNVPIVKNRVLSIGDMTTNQSNTERLLLWESSWHMFLDHPLTGIGTGNYEELYQTRYILPEAKEPRLGHAHNNFMHTLAETGLIGIASFVYMFGYILYTTWRRYREKQHVWMLAACLATIGLLTHGMTEYNFDNSTVMRMYWFILGLGYLRDI